MFSNLFKNYSVNEKLYSHTGVVYIENDSIYVIHAEASELTGIGFVKKEKLSSFLSNIHTWGIYRLNTQASVKEKITCAALQYFDKKTPFDMNFDLSNDDKVYCTQLVANSINRGIGYKLITPGVEFNKRPFYTVDDIYFRPEFDNIYKTSKN